MKNLTLARTVQAAPWIVTAVAIVASVACWLEIQRLQGGIDEIDRLEHASQRPNLR